MRLQESHDVVGHSGRRKFLSARIVRVGNTHFRKPEARQKPRFVLNPEQDRVVPEVPEPVGEVRVRVAKFPVPGPSGQSDEPVGERIKPGEQTPPRGTADAGGREQAVEPNAFPSELIDGGGPDRGNTVTAKVSSAVVCDEN